MESNADQKSMLELLVKIGEGVADLVVGNLRQEGIEVSSQVEAVMKSDVIYKIDRVSEDYIVSQLEEHGEQVGGIVLVAEGISESGTAVFPEGLQETEAAWRLLLDPIDGTRGLMYDKRPGFFLAGAAVNKVQASQLSDISIAVMVEIPTTRMHASDTITAIRGEGIRAFRRDRMAGNRVSFMPRPSSAPIIRGGFAHFSHFFSPGKGVLASMEEELLETLYPDARDKEIVAFEDQYISSGGQLYELLTGKDRFVADLRGSLYNKFNGRMRAGHVCHPYDLAAHLVGKEAGLIITDIQGNELDGPFDTHSPMDWIGYANKSIFEEVYPVLNSLLKKYKFL